MEVKVIEEAEVSVRYKKTSIKSNRKRRAKGFKVLVSV
jgi:hypothetical protein